MTKRRKEREVRLGLVMYGGVSLAIYINGIAQELFRAVRGRGTYRLLKAITDSDVVVDVLSGSSAGGINGVLLAYALCNEREFSGSSRLWRQRGDIGGLMRGINEPLDKYQSLLDSEGKYEPWLKEAFDQLEAAPIDANEREDKSSFEELDLFVTGTDFYGRKAVTIDDRGVGIDVKDHRAVFWLKHRAGRKEPFAPDSNVTDEPKAAKGEHTTHAALARLARITSCFPGAFAPVTVDSDSPVSQRLRRWGAVPKNGGERVYIDGGVLDNKPFSTTLDAIYSRLADRPVSRWLLYVEPDPETFGADPTELRSPAALQVGLASLTSLPGYESIADDLRRLRRHNEQAERITSLRDALVDLAENRALPSVAPAGFEAAGPSSGVTARGVAEGKEYRRLRLVGLGEQVFQALFTREVSGGRGRDELGQLLEAQCVLRAWFTREVVSKSEQEWPTFAKLDVAFRLRRLLHLTYRHQAELNASGLAAAVNRQIETLEVMRSAMKAGVESVARACFGATGETLTEPLTAAWAEHVWKQVFDRVCLVTNVSGPARHARTGTLLFATGPSEATDKDDLKAFARRVSKLSEGSDARGASAAKPLVGHSETSAAKPLVEPLKASPHESFFERSDAFERELLGTDQTLLEAYDNFERIDALLYPIEAVAGLRSYDVVNLARVSPRDAQVGLANKVMEEKVTGTRYGHFAAFFKRSWRSNDILWGRLDGACELVDVLVRQDRLNELFGGETLDPTVQADLTTTIADIEVDPKTLPLPAPERAKLFQWLRRLTSKDATARRAALADFEASKRRTSIDGPLTWLVRGAQLEVLPSGLHDVLSDSHCERLEYEDPGAGSLVVPKSEKLASDELSNIGKTPDTLINYFSKDYKVGSENLRNIPPFVVADWIARALILARNSLLVSAGKHADAVRTSILFQVFFGWPLRALAALSGLLRGAPHWLAAFTLSALSYIVLCGVVLALFHGELKKSEHSVIAGALFVGFPAVLAGFLWFMASLYGPGGWPLKVLRVGAGFVVLLLALCLVPVFYSAFEIDPVTSCSSFPGVIGKACVRVWTPQLSELAPWFVLGAATLGLLSVLGGFGWIGRRLARVEAWYKARQVRKQYWGSA